MHVEMNGKVSVYPTGRPPYVEVYHRLKGIERQLITFKREFDKTSTFNFAAAQASANRADNIRGEYIEALQACSSNINGWHSSKDKFYEILKIFVERTASNDHTVLPFFTYLVEYKHRVERAASREGGSPVPFGSFDEFKQFISDRAEEAIRSCSSYLCMLSESMDSVLKNVNLGQLVSKVFEVQKKVYLLKSYNNHLDLNLPREKRDELKKNLLENTLPFEYSSVTFKDNYGGTIVGFEPLLHILPMFLITNALKATTIAHDCQVQDGSLGEYLARGSNEQAYGKIPLIASPKVEVAISEESRDKISITISDNGIGMPKQMLYDLLTFKSSNTLFRRYTESGGACMHLIGHILDFANGELHAESEIGQGTTFKIILPKKLEFN